MIKIKLATILLFTLFLMACQKKEDKQKWVIENQSTSQIVVQLSYLNEPTKTDTIQPGSKKTIFYISSGLGTGADLSDPTEFMSISISNTQDTLVKNENLETNWTVEIEEKSKSPITYDYTYEFSLSDSDF